MYIYSLLTDWEKLHPLTERASFGIIMIIITSTIVDILYISKTTGDLFNKDCVAS